MLRLAFFISALACMSMVALANEKSLGDNFRYGQPLPDCGAMLRSRNLLILVFLVGPTRTVC